jgi:hypothetical protein
MIQITQSKAMVADEAQLEQLRCEFARRHCVVLPQFLTASLLERVLEKIEAAQFYSNSHRDGRKQEFGWDLTIRENEMALHLIYFLLNSCSLFQIFQRITDCSAIGSFGGRIYRSLPGDWLNWHDDTDVSERVLGISINLSPERYAGGLFQLRERESEQIIWEAGSGNLGDAHLFRISRRLQHRVTRVEGNIPRITAAGWFLSAPDCLTVLKSLAASDVTSERSRSSGG